LPDGDLGALAVGRLVDPPGTLARLPSFVLVGPGDAGVTFRCRLCARCA
jgi:hypothetical protein